MRDTPVRERPMARLKDGRADGWWFPVVASSVYVCTAYWSIPRTLPRPPMESAGDMMNRCGKRWELYVTEPDDPQA